MFSKSDFVDTFLNEPEVNFYSVKWFHLFISDRNNYVYLQ